MNVQIVNTLFSLSVQGTIVGFLILIIRRLFGRHMPARWNYAVWFIVFLKLALPVSVPSMFSVFNLVEHVRPVAQIAVVIDSTATQTAATAVAENITVVSSVANNTAAAYTAEMPAILLQDIYWQDAAVLIWFAVAFALILRYVFAIVNIKLSVYRGRSLERYDELYDIAQQCYRAAGISPDTEIVSSAAVKSPFVLGFFQNVIVVPPNLIGELSGDELRAVILHEATHVRLRHNQIRTFMHIINIIHWFNPFVWLFSSQWRNDMEFDCDDATLGMRQYVRPKEYAGAMLRVAAMGGNNFYPALCFGENNLKRRIDTLAHRRRLSGVGLFLSGALFAMLVITLMPGAEKNSPDAVKPLSGSAGIAYTTAILEPTPYPATAAPNADISALAGKVREAEQALNTTLSSKEEEVAALEARIRENGQALNKAMSLKEEETAVLEARLREAVQALDIALSRKGEAVTVMAVSSSMPSVTMPSVSIPLESIENIKVNASRCDIVYVLSNDGMIGAELIVNDESIYEYYGLDAVKTSADTLEITLTYKDPFINQNNNYVIMNNQNDIKKFQDAVKKPTLKIILPDKEYKKHTLSLNTADITIPDLSLQSLEITLNACSARIDGASIYNLEASINASTLKAVCAVANEVNISDNAGTLTFLNTISAEKVKVISNAGHSTVYVGAEPKVLGLSSNAGKLDCIFDHSPKSFSIKGSYQMSDVSYPKEWNSFVTNSKNKINGKKNEGAMSVDFSCNVGELNFEISEQKR